MAASFLRKKPPIIPISILTPSFRSTYSTFFTNYHSLKPYPCYRSSFLLSSHTRDFHSQVLFEKKKGTPKKPKKSKLVEGLIENEIERSQLEKGKTKESKKRKSKKTKVNEDKIEEPKVQNQEKLILENEEKDEIIDLEYSKNRLCKHEGKSNIGPKWFQLSTGMPCYSVSRRSKEGEVKPPTILEARKQGLVPSAQSILALIYNPEIESWNIKYLLLSIWKLQLEKEKAVLSRMKQFGLDTNIEGENQNEIQDEGEIQEIEFQEFFHPESGILYGESSQENPLTMESDELDLDPQKYISHLQKDINKYKIDQSANKIKNSTLQCLQKLQMNQRPSRWPSKIDFYRPFFLQWIDKHVKQILRTNLSYSSPFGFGGNCDAIVLLHDDTIGIINIKVQTSEEDAVHFFHFWGVEAAANAVGIGLPGAKLITLCFHVNPKPSFQVKVWGSSENNQLPQSKPQVQTQIQTISPSQNKKRKGRKEEKLLDQDNILHDQNEPERFLNELLFETNGNYIGGEKNFDLDKNLGQFLEQQVEKNEMEMERFDRIQNIELIDSSSPLKINEEEKEAKEKGKTSKKSRTKKEKDLSIQTPLSVENPSEVKQNQNQSQSNDPWKLNWKANLDQNEQYWNDFKMAFEFWKAQSNKNFDPVSLFQSCIPIPDWKEITKILENQKTVKTSQIEL